MKHAFSCLLVILWPFLNAICQPAARPLTVGDPVPDYLIRNLVNYKTPTARLSDFKDKLLILDFMTSFCGSCITNLFRIDTIESRYHGRLQVLPVTYEPKGVVQEFLQKPFLGNKVNASFATQDTVLKSWFPHVFVSHMVWIHNGIVKAITNPEYVTAENIETVLRNKPVNWPVKRDVGNYDPAYPLLSPNPESVMATNYPALKYYSTVPAYMDGFASASGLFVDSANDLQRFYVINESIIRLYLQAFGRPYTFPASCILLNMRDTGRLLFNHQGYQSAWRAKNYYCYEASFSLPASLTTIQERMQADLAFYLHLKGNLEKRKMRCLVIRPIPGATQVSAPPSNDIIDMIGLTIKLNGIHSGLPAINEMPGKKRIYVEYPPSLRDIPAIKKILLQHGIEAVEEEREFEVLVLSDTATEP